MSRQKSRQHQRLTPEQALEDKVRSLADRPGVLSVDAHFSGAYNELGLTIHLHPASSEADYRALRETLLDALPTPSAGATTWMLIFKRDGKVLDTVFPGDV
jgi:hypothetical protein